MKLISAFLMITSACFALVYRHEGGGEWTEEALPQFDEMIISWNAPRPVKGNYRIYARVKTEEWSPWFLYATWGAEGQTSYRHEEKGIRVYQDALEVLNGKKANAFSVKVESDDEIQDMPSLVVYIDIDICLMMGEILPTESVSLQVSGLSQMTLNHPRAATSFSSPVSTATVVSFLLQRPVDPVSFAGNVWDRGFDIYENWVFNTAEAAAQLGNPWECYVTRLTGFNALYYRLQQGTPVVVCIQSPLSESAHLVITGYDAEKDRVLSMDPAFPSHEKTITSYDREEFMAAWNQRGRVAYIFQLKE